MLHSDIYWLIFNAIDCPKTFIRLSITNNALQRISQDEQLRQKFIIRGTKLIYRFDEYYVNLLTGGKFHGKCIKYNNNLISEITTYKNDQLDGLRELRFKNGQLSYKFNFQNGKWHGLYESWFSDGKLHLRTIYVNDTIDGLYEEWYDNGQIAFRINYKNGLYHGLYESWRFNGKIYLKDTYINDRKIESYS